MSDFMKWLYGHYIKKELDGIPQEDYAFWFSLLDCELSPDGWEYYEKCAEFTAIHAFLLGLRTGQGIPR